MIIPRTVPRVRRSLRARTLAILCTALLSALLSVVPMQALASTEEEQDGTVEIALVLGDHGAASADAPLSGAVTIENGTGEALSAGQVSLELDRTPLADHSAVSAWLNAGTAEELDTVYSAPTETISAETTVTAPTLVSPELLHGLAAGVYPVRATLTGADGTDSGTGWNISIRSVLTIRSADASESAPVAVLVPITATPSSGALLSADELTALTAVDGALTAQLDGIAGTAAVIAIDPAIVAAIRVLGTAAPQTATDWLNRLEALPNETFALQFGDADATVQARAGLDELLAPASLDVFIDPATIREDLGPTPSPTPSEADQLPALEALTGIRGEVTGLLWPDADVTDEDLATFSDYLGSDSATILPSSTVDAPGAHASVGSETVLVTDSTVSDLLSQAAATTSLSARSGLLAEATAALHFLGSPTSGVLIGLDRDETRTAAALREAVETAEPVALAAVRATTASAGSIVGEASSDRATALQQLLLDEGRLQDFSSILEDPELLLTPERIKILRLIAVGTSDADFAAELSDHRDATKDTLDAVAIQPYTGQIQLISANVDMPVWIRNDLPWPVTLTLEVRPSDPRIDIETHTVVEATAASNTRVLLPVAARVASGELTVRFAMTSSTGVPIGQPQSADVTVRAEWENIGLGILGALIALLLGFGVFRTVRRRKRERAVAAGDGSSEDVGPEASVTAASDPALDERE